MDKLYVPIFFKFDSDKPGNTNVKKVIKIE